MKPVFLQKTHQRKREKFVSIKNPASNTNWKTGAHHSVKLPLFLQGQKMSHNNHGLIQRQIEPESGIEGSLKEKDEIKQSKKYPGRKPAESSKLGIRTQNSRQGGQPLPAYIRNFFEPRLGVDFSNVKIHTDEAASDSARALNARAFTSQGDIVFADDQYEPETDRGQRLLAHELVHVVQQRSASGVGHQNTVLRQTWDQYQSVPPEEQAEQCTDPCSVVDRQAFAGHLIDARNQLEAAGAGFGRVVNWTKITKEMAADLKGKMLQTPEELEKLNRSKKYTQPPEYNIPYCYHELKGAARSKWFPICDFDNKKARLVQIAGTPAEAVEDIFQNLQNWQFDCAEYLQVARWYAQLRTLDPACFNARIKRLSPVKLMFFPIFLELKPHGSSGIVGRKLYQKASPHDLHFFLEDKVAQQTLRTTETDFTLLEKAPIGSRVTWTNRAAPGNSSYRNENTYKIGDHLYMSHPWGTGTRQYIECQLAARTLPQELLQTASSSRWFRQTAERVLRNTLIEECQRGEMRPAMDLHIRDNVYISRIVFFEF